MKKLSLLLVSVLCALTLSAQPFGGRQIASPVVNPDNTVTFSLRAPNATEVLVDVQFAGRNKMAKDADGIWSITLGPAPADIYPYCFIVDGVNVMDPLNPDWFPNEKFKNSLLDMRGKAYSANAPKDQAYWQSMQNVPHGKTDFILFPSKAAGLDFPAVVYLPPSYGQSDRKYPVFVLISGTTDTEEVYYKVGRVNFILDNLIAEGKAQEMIVVMP
ncbi:MAG: esterase, partial [Bacteroidales bacterium]|nr:esterase [Bacteroidales bacterium]